MRHSRLLRFGLFVLLMMIGTFASIPVTQAGDYSVSLEIMQATCYTGYDDSYSTVEVGFVMWVTTPGLVWGYQWLGFSPDRPGSSSLIGGAMYEDTGSTQGNIGIGGYGVKFPFTFVMTGSLYNGPLWDESGAPLYADLIAETSITGTCLGPGEAIIGDTSAQGNDAPFNPGDGRLQPEAGAPVAVYCREGGVEIYAIDSNSEGEIALNVDLEAVSGDAPSENELIASEGNIRLYWLTTGELQVNAGPDAEGKEYVMIWDGCS